MPQAPALLPRLMGESAAAAYLGVSATTLRALGLPRKKCGERRFLYDRFDLDAYADDLPYEDRHQKARRECDEAFGCDT